MTKLLLCSTLLLFTTSLHADVPGNKPRPETSVYVRGLDHLPKDWVLYYESDITHQSRSIKRDTTLILRGGYGRPDGVNIWAQNKTTGEETNSINYYNGSELNTLNILTVRNDSLIFDSNNSKSRTKSDKKNRSNKVKKNGFMLLDFLDSDEDAPTGMLMVVAAISLGLLGWMYFRRNKTEKKVA